MPDAPEPLPRTRGRFQETSWSVVLRASGKPSSESSEALENLCRAYWPPLYAFARRDGHGPEEAQDLTQEFFSRLLKNNYLQAADPNRGRFRSFLLGSFKHMIANERRHASRLKRGGDAVVFSLDAWKPEDGYSPEPTHELTPERLFERQWAEVVLARTLDRLEAEHTGQAMRFEELKTFLLDAKGAAPVAAVAARLGVSESALKSVVHRMRRRYAQLFRDEVAQTEDRSAEVDEEIRHLLRTLAG